MQLFMIDPTLGMFSDMPYEQATLSLASGDLLLIYTDGASEALNGDQEEFGEMRIGKVLSEHPEATPQEILSRLTAEVTLFHGDHPFEDDLTLLVARVH